MFFKKEYLKYNIAFGLLLIVLLISASLAFSHGGKHAPGEFTNLQALKEATKLYNQLIGKNWIKAGKINFPRLMCSNEKRTIKTKLWCPFSGQVVNRKQYIFSLIPAASIPGPTLAGIRLISY
jgi:hypothetical protein